MSGGLKEKTRTGVLIRRRLKWRKSQIKTKEGLCKKQDSFQLLSDYLITSFNSQVAGKKDPALIPRSNTLDSHMTPSKKLTFSERSHSLQAEPQSVLSESST